MNPPNPDPAPYSARPYILGETAWRDVSGTKYEVAILPWGATEAHNYHLPYGTDIIEVTRIAAHAARLAWEAGARVVVLPTVPFGVQTGQLDIPLCLNLNPSTQAAIIGDLARALSGQGLHKLLILNGHGGNDFRAIIRELQPQIDLFLCTLDWFRCMDPSVFFTEPGDHAGEMETSLMMHLAPELVLPLDQAGPGSERRSRVAAFREGWAWAPRRWTAVSKDTGVGDPAAATPAKGAEYANALAERIAGFLVELASLGPDDPYE